MRHPDLPLLLHHAGGNIDETEDLLIASHVDICAECSGFVASAESFFGETLDNLEPTPLSPGRIEGAVETAGSLAPLAPPPSRVRDPEIPGPLLDHIGGNLSQVEWEQISPTTWFSRWRLDQGRAMARLIRVAPGGRVPEHRHNGFETLLVLRGWFSDEFGRYEKGDVVRLEPGSCHVAIAPEVECICLLVLSDGQEFLEPLWS